MSTTTDTTRDPRDYPSPRALRELQRSGTSYASIGREVGCNRTAVSHYAAGRVCPTLLVATRMWARWQIPMQGWPVEALAERSSS